MALKAIKSWRVPLARAIFCCLLLFPRAATAMSGWGGCLDGQDVFASVRENSLAGELVTELYTDATGEGIRWSLTGEDGDWFFLDGWNLRLNTSPEKVLDREVQGAVLMAELSCYEDDILMSVYRIMVEVIDENDNPPVFAENTVQSVTISELTPANTVVFTVHATDADNDKIIYSIDQTSPDAGYFKVELPNSGEVMLSKPLDYETKATLTVTIHASEMSTAEHFNTSTAVTVTVLDGDDQYPQFLPCTPLFRDQSDHICVNPVYAVNVTEGEEDIILHFSPGPIHAVDGDKGLSSPVSYAILPGDADADGHFLMDRRTGEVRLVQGVKDRLATPTLRLQIMAYQDDDPRKYTVATALVRVRALNRFPPEFDRAEYSGFATEDKSPAALLNTYGGKALVLRVRDRDFADGINPTIHLSFSPTSNNTDFYRVTQEGLVIARADQLKGKQRHILQVAAVDQESGDAAYASIVVEILDEGQAIPRIPPGDERLIGCTVGKALVLCFLFMSMLGCVMMVMSWMTRTHKWKKDPLERGCVAQGKHPNVSLRWFQLMSHRNPMPQMDEIPFNDGELGTYNASFSLQDKAAIYINKDPPPCRGPTPCSTVAAPDASVVPMEAARGPACLNNGDLPIKCVASAPVIHRPVVTESHSKMPPKKPAAEPPPRTAPDATEPASPRPESEQGVSSPSEPSQANDPFDPVDLDDEPSSCPASPTALGGDPAFAETDPPYHAPGSGTPPEPSPSHQGAASPSPKQTSTPPPTPENAPLKARLVHLDTSPASTPPKSPEKTSTLPSIDAGDSRSTSPDQAGGTDSGSPTQQRAASAPPAPPANSGSAPGGPKEGEEGEEGGGGFPGHEDADKTSEGDDELEPDEEELLRVLARLHPVFITISK